MLLLNGEILTIQRRTAQSNFAENAGKHQQHSSGVANVHQYIEPSNQRQPKDQQHHDSNHGNTHRSKETGFLIPVYHSTSKINDTVSFSSVIGDVSVSEDGDRFA